MDRFSLYKRMVARRPCVAIQITGRQTSRHSTEMLRKTWEDQYNLDVLSVSYGRQSSVTTIASQQARESVVILVSTKAPCNMLPPDQDCQSSTGEYHEAPPSHREPPMALFFPFQRTCQACNLIFQGAVRLRLRFLETPVKHSSWDGARSYDP